MGVSSVTVSPCGGTPAQCSVAPLTVGVNSAVSDYSCAVQERSCSGLYCVAPGTYDVTITAPGAPGSVEYQYVNQWVSLSSSVSDSLRGREAHFYEITDANQALSVVLTVTSGPAVEFILSEGCSSVTGAVRYQETKTCAFGECPIWIPTRPESPRASSLYVIVDSQTVSATRLTTRI